MKIALIGYGKMGKTIEQIALKDGHEIVARIDKSTHDNWAPDLLQSAEVAIEFSQPESALENIFKCFDANVPVVCGTTGWLQNMPEITKRVNDEGHSFFYASNYSIGVNVFFEINKLLATLMDTHEGYDEVLIHETHHLQKLDSPSGTAITLAQQIIERVARLKTWTNYSGEESVSSQGTDTASEIPIFSSRADDVAGTHIVKYFSDEDEIEIIHKAFNRLGFAKGALTAAIWLQGRKGCFGMQDLLSLNS
ncbi:MAG: 4-hydroxy-tetrahydrodipicolinate reductase [Bacteroidetes bacterium]|nr:MAG: 4-hydroxy-tetrahydrodipicolinate reductase [Bacteroidota bacterium]